MLQEAFKEEALSKIQVYEWYSRFKGGEMSCEDQPRCDRPSTCRNDQNLEKFATHSMQIIVGPLMIRISEITR